MRMMNKKGKTLKLSPKSKMWKKAMRRRMTLIWTMMNFRMRIPFLQVPVSNPAKNQKVIKLFWMTQIDCPNMPKYYTYQIQNQIIHKQINWKLKYISESESETVPKERLNQQLWGLYLKLFPLLHIAD